MRLPILQTLAIQHGYHRSAHRCRSQCFMSSWTHVVETSIEGSLRKDCAVRGGDTLLAMVSGGSDSVAMLHALNRVRTKWNPSLNLEVMHFNHGLREDAEKDTEFVESLSDTLGLSSYVHRWPSSASPLTQASARSWRRTVALEHVERLKPAKCHVVLAHHADDQLETALLRLARGSRLHLLFAGMQPYSAPCFARPLLHLSKTQLRDYLEDGLQAGWREDLSNLDPDKYARNKVRLKLVPPLTELAEGPEALRRRLEALADQSQKLNAWLEDLAHVEMTKRHTVRNFGPAGLALHDWHTLPEPLRHHIVSKFVADATSSAITYAHLTDIDRRILTADSLEWDICLPGAIRIRRRGRVLDIHCNDTVKNCSTDIACADIFVTVPDNTWTIKAHRGVSGLNCTLHLRNIPPGAHLQLRSRRDGDRFHPPWRNHSSKLKDFLRGQRLDYFARDDIPILALPDNTIIAVLLDDTNVCVAPSFAASSYPADDFDTFLSLSIRKRKNESVYKNRS